MASDSKMRFGCMVCNSMHYSGLRLDPASKPQELDLIDIEVRCRISK
ncbi:MAG: hypothetical protein ABSG35_00575 [Syntrophobacteraceae bacterium]